MTMEMMNQCPCSRPRPEKDGYIAQCASAIANAVLQIAVLQIPSLKKTGKSLRIREVFDGDRKGPSCEPIFTFETVSDDETQPVLTSSIRHAFKWHRTNRFFVEEINRCLVEEVNRRLLEDKYGKNDNE